MLTQSHKWDGTYMLKLIKEINYIYGWELSKNSLEQFPRIVDLKPLVN